MRSSRTSLAASVRAELARAKISQRELARHLGVSHTYVQRRASGERSFSADDLISIAAFINVDPGRFFEVREQMHPQPTPAPTANGSAA